MVMALLLHITAISKFVACDSSLVQSFRITTPTKMILNLKNFQMNFRSVSVMSLNK